MSDIVIRVDNLGKQYKIGRVQQRYATLRDTLMDAMKAPFHRASKLLRGEAYGAAGLDETIWALKDVSFNIEQGEVVGIIGRNGAGKSTLLKILSRITEPTEGSVDLHGRVGALLEVGTGFHPELTGRENIYLNGSILGMHRVEIDRKFDEIVDFAGVEKFIDTPVKHYSSGMALRLGFSVAAHLDLEILLVDEVLAVGDYAFQKRCLGKMGEVATSGRTILFVSHDMGAINQLCQRGVLLNHGRIETSGPIQEVVETYVSGASNKASVRREFPVDKSKPIQIRAIEILDENRQSTSDFQVGDIVYLHITYQVHCPIEGANLVINLTYKATDVLMSFDTDDLNNRHYLDQRTPGVYHYKMRLPTDILKAGPYSALVGTGVISRGPIENHWNAITFHINETAEDTNLRGYAERRRGVLRMPIQWTDES